MGFVDGQDATGEESFSFILSHKPAHFSIWLKILLCLSYRPGYEIHIPFGELSCGLLGTSDVAIYIPTFYVPTSALLFP